MSLVQCNNAFKVGDKAVHRAHGVGVIQSIESDMVSGHKVQWYILQFLSSGAKIKVPISNSARPVIRNLISSTQIKNVYSILKSPGNIPQTSWNRRFNMFKDKLTTGSLEDIAEVLRDLNSLKIKKDLSFSEKNMLERARDMIIEEISAASSQPSEIVQEELEKILLPN